MTAEILIKFARKGIILSPEAYDLIKNSKNPINLSSEIIVIFPFESSITFVNIFNLILYLYYLLIVNKIIYIALFFDNLIIYK